MWITLFITLNIKKGIADIEYCIPL